MYTRLYIMNLQNIYSIFSYIPCSGLEDILYCGQISHLFKMSASRHFKKVWNWSMEVGSRPQWGEMYIHKHSQNMNAVKPANIAR